jgi:hypothetical protein
MKRSRFGKNTLLALCTATVFLTVFSTTKPACAWQEYDSSTTPSATTQNQHYESGPSKATITDTTKPKFVNRYDGFMFRFNLAPGGKGLSFTKQGSGVIIDKALNPLRPAASFKIRIPLGGDQTTRTTYQLRLGAADD